MNSSYDDEEEVVGEEELSDEVEVDGEGVMGVEANHPPTPQDIVVDAG